MTSVTRPTKGRKAIRTLLVVLVMILTTVVLSLAVYAVVKATATTPVSVPATITPSTPCPVTGCQTTTCHGPDPAPTPAAGQELVCPVMGCTSVHCHAIGMVTSHYESSDKSAQYWIAGLCAFVIATIAIALRAKE